MLKNKNDIMKHLLRSLLIFFCSLSLLPGAASNLETNIRHRMEKDLSPIIEADLVRLHLPGLSIALVMDGDIVWTRGLK